MKRLLTAFLVLFSLQVNAQTFQEYTGGGLENRLRYTSTDPDTTNLVIENVVLASGSYVDPPNNRRFNYQLNQIGSPLIWAEVEAKLTGTGCTSAGVGCFLTITKVLRSSDLNPSTAAYDLPDFGGSILAGSAIPVDRLDRAIGGCDGVLLLGQSNMVGWVGSNGSGGNVINPVLDAPDPYIYQWSESGLAVIEGQDPLEHPEDISNIGVGLGMSFAKSMLSFNQDNHYARVGPVRPICLIPLAQGATGITSRTGGAGAKPRCWNDPNMLPPDGGACYIRTVDRVDKFLADRSGNTVVAMLYLQGEEDARSGNAGRQPGDWSTDVADMFASLRATYPELSTVPIIYGELTDFTASDPSQYPDGSEIQAQINGTSVTDPTLDSLLPFSEVCLTDNLNPLWRDGLHFSDEGYRALGQCFFDSYLIVTNQSSSAGVPGAPQNVQAVVSGAGDGLTAEIDVCWSPLTANPAVTSYTLYDVTGPEIEIESGITGTCASTITGLALQTDKDYEVSATNSLGEGTNRGSDSVNTGDIPNAFSQNVPSLPGSGQVTVTWTDPTAFNTDTPVLGCTAQYKLSSEPTIWTNSSTGEVSLGTQTDTITGLTPVSHDFRVSCRSAVGPRLSNTQTITPTGGNFPPPAPANFTVSNVVGGFSLSWDKPTGVPDVDDATPSYRIYQQTNQAGGFVEVATVNTNTFVTISAGINTTDEYEFQVAGDNTECASQPGGKCPVSQSGVESLNVPPLTGLVVSSPVIDEVSIQWTAQVVEPACDASGNWYKIQRQVNGGGYSDLVEVTAITYTDTAVSNGNTYQYRVRCINGNEDANSYAVSDPIDPTGPGSAYANTWALSGLELHVQFNLESGIPEAEKSLSCISDGNPCSSNNQDVDQWYVPDKGVPPAGLGYIDYTAIAGANNPMQYNAASGGMVATNPTNRHMVYFDGGSCTPPSGCTGGVSSSTTFSDGYYKLFRVETFRTPMSSENFISWQGWDDVAWIVNDGSGRLCMGGDDGIASLCSTSALPVGAHVMSFVHNGLDEPSAVGQIHVYDVSFLSDTTGACATANNGAPAVPGTLANPTVLCTNAEGGYWSFETSDQMEADAGNTGRMVINGWSGNVNGNPSNGCDDCLYRNIILGTDGASYLAPNVSVTPWLPNSDLIEVIKEMDTDS